jgi:hypothetical protein
MCHQHRDVKALVLPPRNQTKPETGIRAICVGGRQDQEG